ncbi:hypothetical protein [Propionivibrio sp.]|uniref:hypothetical protein n=1 Tax=Propionivibrio sp. TaxID=2212460 RepID=UPI003BF37BB6
MLKALIAFSVLAVLAAVGFAVIIFGPPIPLSMVPDPIFQLIKGQSKEAYMAKDRLWPAEEAERQLVEIRTWCAANNPKPACFRESKKTYIASFKDSVARERALPIIAGRPQAPGYLEIIAILKKAER